MSQFGDGPLEAAQSLGQDSEAVLAQHLGLGADELAALVADGVVQRPEPDADEPAERGTPAAQAAST